MFDETTAKIAVYTQIINEDGTIQNVLQQVIDNRDLEACKAARIESIKKSCEEAILRDVPYFKQTNLANGLYDNAKSQELKNKIQNHRTKCDQLEALVNAAQTPDEVEKVFWIEG